jgi:hypothetical protein
MPWLIDTAVPLPGDGSTAGLCYEPYSGIAMLFEALLMLTTIAFIAL